MSKESKNPMHISDKHPFQGNGKTPTPKMGKSEAAHKTAAGAAKPFSSANASMKGKS